MSPEQTLLYESRARSRQVVVAVVAGVVLLIAAVVQLAGPHTSVNEETLSLLTLNKRFPIDLISSALNAIATFAAAGTLLYLWRITFNRNPEKVKPFIRWIVIVGALLDGVIGVAYAAILSIKAHEFATSGSQTYQQANHLTTGSGLLVLQVLALLGALLLALGFVLVAVQGMSVGLLTRPMGYLGMFAGALILFQVLQLPIIQTGWLLALAYLFSGRWPSGLPLAWRSGKAEPWPSSAEVRNRRVAEASASRAKRGRQEPVVSTTPDSEDVEAAARTRSNTPKRKRKRRN